MTVFASFADIATACLNLPAGSDAAADLARDRQASLLKPPGSLGRLEDLAIWLARWQGSDRPRLEQVDILVFAGNHGVTAQGVSPYPATVTRQMVDNFASGGAAICQLAAQAAARLRVIPMRLDTPTRDFTTAPAMNEAEFAAHVSEGFAAVAPGTDLLALGEMGIGNTTAAAALAAALFGGGGTRWAGRGTGLDDAGVAHKAAVIDAALLRHGAALCDPLADPLMAASTLGGRELAGILGATLAARRLGIPVLLDGFVCTAAASVLARLAPGGLDHALVAHVSAEAGHRALVAALDKTPLLDLGMRLGEASGAALAIPILRAALACHLGMAVFAQAGVDDRT
jgi:nicotinate-nucleotide--dimethylbenzimidazole phosphoribosyltransferase